MALGPCDCSASYSKLFDILLRILGICMLGLLHRFIEAAGGKRVSDFLEEDIAPLRHFTWVMGHRDSLQGASHVEVPSPAIPARTDHVVVLFSRSTSSAAAGLIVRNRGKYSNSFLQEGEKASLPGGRPLRSPRRRAQRLWQITISFDSCHPLVVIETPCRAKTQAESFSAP